MGRPRTVIINWSYPRLLRDIETSPYANDIGIYFVTRKTTYRGISREYVVYIGKTHQDFVTRMRQHFKKGKLPNNSSNYFVRLGRIELLTPLSDEDMKILIRDVESGLIFHLKNYMDIDQRYMINVSQTSSYTALYGLRIENHGKHGVLPSLVDTNEH